MGNQSYPISIFILDVSNSSTNAIGDELTAYLDELVNWINIWTKPLGTMKVKHRAGDEIIFVGYGYSTAYTIAFFISSIWKYHQYRPYFGLSFGDIEKELADLDIEKWIHPLIKQARYANDLLKQEQTRQPFKFELDLFIQSQPNHPFLYNQFRKEFKSLFNTLLSLQHSLTQAQTNIQTLVCSAYLILQQQKAVGHLLNKTAPTISSHMKKGKCEEILHSFDELLIILNSLEKKTYPEEVNPKERNEQLIQSIRNYLKEHINILLTD
ncbi:hypothetical protein [Neobacillus jeddahensis]|uniref:hypothetical protein n=1 Tax=Neobacillus jeddahensis TaxID=1461580 RepID=UPI00058AD2CE|nr:hypothetical protein [Neobacillus jeddahensis]